MLPEPITHVRDQMQVEWAAMHPSKDDDDRALEQRDICNMRFYRHGAGFAFVGRDAREGFIPVAG